MNHISNVAAESVDVARRSRQAVLRAVAGPAKAESADDLLGTWRVVSVDVFNAHLHCDLDSFSDWFITFSENNRASVHLYGNRVETDFDVSDGVVSFGSSHLASVLLDAEDGRLHLSGVGMKFTFAPDMP